DAGIDEPGDAVLSQRETRDRHKRLGQALRRLPEPFRLAAGEQERLHQSFSSGSRAASGSAGDAWRGRPMPSYAKPAARVATGSRRLRPSTISGRAIASRTSGVAMAASSGHSVTITA